MDHLALIAEASDAFLAACAAGDLNDRVGACPGWTVADLLGHLGVVQRFHGGHLVRGVTDPPPGPRPVPPAPEDLHTWFTEGAATLLANLAATPPDTPAWTFDPATPTAAFWRRRMLHEAVVHRHDAESARGTPTRIAPIVAADGIDEYLTVFLPRRSTGEHPVGRVEVVAGGRTWTTGDPAAGDPAAGDPADGDPGAASATIRGTAEDVLLVLWGRRPLAVVEVEGDVGLAESLVND